MRVSRKFCVFAAVACAWSAPLLADDPRDPTMTPEAIARDRATIRRLNREQLEYVQRRDAGYARGWRAAADARAARSQASDDDADYADMHADYAEQRRRYDRAVRDWQDDVAACRAGYYDRCDRR